MTKFKYPTLLLFSLLLTTVACSKDDEETTPKDTTDPIITVISPADGSTIQSGVVTVSGTIEEEGELEEVVLEGSISSIPYGQSETITKDQLPPKDGNIYAISQEYNIPSGVTGEVTIKIIATDNAGNIGEKTVKYTLE